MNIADEIDAGRAVIASLPAITDHALIGSAMYLPQANDVDFAVLLMHGDACTYVSDLALKGDGWSHCGEEYDSAAGTWAAVRRGNLNLMVTHDRNFFEGYKLAMEVCKALRLTNKPDRIAVCKVVRDRMPADLVRASVYGESA
jgi:hypothetical protein